MSTNIDQDKQIAAASLLALVGSVSKSPSNTSTSSSNNSDAWDARAVKRKPGGGDEVGPAPKRMMIMTPREQGNSNVRSDCPKKVSDDESSQRNTNNNHHRRSSTMSTMDGEVEVEVEVPVVQVLDQEVKVSRRHSCPMNPTSNSEYTSSSTCSAKKNKLKSQVPSVLMNLLTNEESEHQRMGLGNTMTFLPDGNKFVIRNCPAFSDYIMPKYFSMTKFGCFIRKLERWGFTHSIPDKQSDQHIFYHPFFSRNNRASLHKVRYTPTRGEAVQQKHNKKSSPSTRVSNEKKDDNGTTRRKQLHNGDTGEMERNLENAIHKELIISRQLENGLATLAKIRDHAPPSSTFETLSSCSSLLPRVSKTVPNSICFQSQTAMNHATKDIVARAIDCLLYDEEHTLQLLARRGEELQARRLSLPCLYSSRANKFGNSSNNP